MDILRATAVVCGLVFAWASPSLAETWQAQGAGAIDEGDPRVDATLLVDVAAVVPGTAFRVGVLLRMDRGWHVYWKNSGDAGFPTEIEWTSSEVGFGTLQFPAPAVFLESDGLTKTFGYADEVLLFTEAALPPGETNVVRIRAQVRFLACKERCIPGEIRLEAALPSAVGAGDNRSPVKPLFDQYAKRVPGPAETYGVTVESSYSKDSIGPGDVFELVIGVTPCSQGSHECPSSVAFALSPGEFATDVPGALDLEIVGGIAHPTANGGALLVVRGRVLQGQDPPDKIQGVLGLLIDGRPQSVAVALPFPTGR